MIVTDPQALPGVLGQSHAELEALVVGEAPLDDPRVRRVADRQAAVAAARGEYVAFADAPWPADRLARQVDATQRAGALMSHMDPEPQTGGAMIHRLLIAEGLTLPADEADDAALFARRLRASARGSALIGGELSALI